MDRVTDGRKTIAAPKSVHSLVFLLVRDYNYHDKIFATTVYWRERDQQKFGQKLDSEDGEVPSKRGHLKDPLERGEGSKAIHRITYLLEA
jgi:hypothetical protein